ncbi:MAG: hypothetical protein V4543_12615 [Bacteroidota bacterium]
MIINKSLSRTIKGLKLRSLAVLTLGLAVFGALPFISGCTPDTSDANPIHFQRDSLGFGVKLADTYYAWDIDSTDIVGNGATSTNYLFSNLSRNIYIDPTKALHMRVSFNGGKWYGTAITSREDVGYGTYMFRMRSDYAANLDTSIAFSFSTYNPSATQANSQLEIAMNNYTGTTDTASLLYSVAPVLDVNTSDRIFGKFIGKRAESPYILHRIKWRLNYVEFTTFNVSTPEWNPGDTLPKNIPIAKWTLKPTVPVTKPGYNGAKSDPILIPKPLVGTKAIFVFFAPNGIGMPNKSITTDKELVLSGYSYKPW